MDKDFESRIRRSKNCIKESNVDNYSEIYQKAMQKKTKIFSFKLLFPSLTSILCGLLLIFVFSLFIKENEITFEPNGEKSSKDELVITKYNSFVSANISFSNSQYYETSSEEVVSNINVHKYYNKDIKQSKYSYSDKLVSIINENDNQININIFKINDSVKYYKTLNFLKTTQKEITYLKTIITEKYFVVLVSFNENVNGVNETYSKIYLYDINSFSLYDTLMINGDVVYCNYLNNQLYITSINTDVNSFRQKKETNYNIIKTNYFGDNYLLYVCLYKYDLITNKTESIYFQVDNINDIYMLNNFICIKKEKVDIYNNVTTKLMLINVNDFEDIKYLDDNIVFLNEKFIFEKGDVIYSLNTKHTSNVNTKNTYYLSKYVLNDDKYILSRRIKLFDDVISEAEEKDNKLLIKGINKVYNVDLQSFKYKYIEDDDLIILDDVIISVQIANYHNNLNNIFVTTYTKELNVISTIKVLDNIVIDSYNLKTPIINNDNKYILSINGKDYLYDIIYSDQIDYKLLNVYDSNHFIYLLNNDTIYQINDKVIKGN